jgi:hypothetical protein
MAFAAHGQTQKVGCAAGEDQRPRSVRHCWWDTGRGAQTRAADAHQAGPADGHALFRLRVMVAPVMSLRRMSRAVVEQLAMRAASDGTILRPLFRSNCAGSAGRIARSARSRKF